MGTIRTGCLALLLAAIPGCSCNSPAVTDAGHDAGTDAGSCRAGAECTLSNPCQQAGITVCTSGLESCVSAGPRADGAACGADQVCSAGQCVTCAAAVACTPANICHLGATDCATGSQRCVDTSQSLDAGTPCGSNLVCSPAGTCLSCAAGQSCTPQNLCHLGATDCATGALSCVDTNVNRDAGAPCGTAQVCSPVGSCISCDAGSACALAGVECRAAQVVCSTGASVCTDTGPGPDGASCDGGACVGGSCRLPLIISTAVNLSTDSLTAGRTCGESPAWPVTALSPSSAALASGPDAGCLATGDRVLLINLQGTPDDFGNVGTYELLTVASVNGSTVAFTSMKTLAFGNADGGESDLSTDAGQKVALQRVPAFAEVVITDAGSLTANPFDGFVGGVVALRAASLSVDGTISASGLGYRNGEWSQDDSSCSESLDTGSGESFTGPSQHSTAVNGGGAGGISALSGVSFNGNDPLNASAGHSDAGQAGANGNGRTIGPPGIAYGAPGGARLTMGSGLSGNLTCTNAFSGPPRYLPQATNSGGIVYLTANQLTVSAAGRITASAVPVGRSTAASGGYVLLRGLQLDVGTSRVTAEGVTESSVGGFTNASSPGYIALQSVNGVTGTTSPPATATTITAP